MIRALLLLPLRPFLRRIEAELDAMEADLGEALDRWERATTVVD